MTREKLIRMGRGFADDVGSIRKLVNPTDDDYAAIGQCLMDAVADMEPGDVFDDDQLRRIGRDWGPGHEEPHPYKSRVEEHV